MLLLSFCFCMLHVFRIKLLPWPFEDSSQRNLWCYDHILKTDLLNSGGSVCLSSLHFFVIMSSFDALVHFAYVVPVNQRQSKQKPIRIPAVKSKVLLLYFDGHILFTLANNAEILEVESEVRRFIQRLVRLCFQSVYILQSISSNSASIVIEIQILWKAWDE